MTDNGGVYIAEACHPDTGELLSFVHYKEKDGMLELTNFKARLSRATLDQGVTSKREKDHLAGAHGEGFKIAALVMVHLESSVFSRQLETCLGSRMEPLPTLGSDMYDTCLDSTGWPSPKD